MKKVEITTLTDKKIVVVENEYIKGKIYARARIRKLRRNDLNGFGTKRT